MKRRLCSMFMALCMVASFLPCVSIPASAADNYDLVDGYITDANRTMAYKDKGSHTIDIKGNYKDSWIKTTYSNGGYVMTSKNLSDATVIASADFVNGGKYIQLSYTVTAGGDGVTDGGLAIYADTMIGENDMAAIEVIQDTSGKVIGLKMVDDKSSNGTYDAQFNLYFDSTGGVTPVTTYWFGAYPYRNDKCWDQLSASAAVADDGTYSDNYTEYSGDDSAMAWSWQNISLEAGQSQIYSVILGVGERSDPPQWNSGNAVLLTLAAEVEQNNRLVNVSASVMDAAGLTDTLYYNVNGGEGNSLGSTVADGSTMKAITVQLDLSSYAVGSYTFSFWVVNSKGAASASVERLITINADGRIEGLDSGGEPEPAAQNLSITRDGNTMYYEDLGHAFAAAEDGDEIVVLNSYTEYANAVMPDKTLTVNFGSNTITAGNVDNEAARGESGIKASSGSLTLNGTTGGYTGCLEIGDMEGSLTGRVTICGGTYASVMLAPNGELNMTSGHIQGMISQAGGTLTICGGTVGLLYAYAGTTELSGGTFTSLSNTGETVLDGKGIVYLHETDVDAETALMGMLAAGKAYDQTVFAGADAEEGFAYLPGPVTVINKTDFSISGDVKDGSDNSASGVTVKLMKGNTLVAQTTTNSEGQYTFHAPAGVYNIVAEKDGVTITVLVTVTENTTVSTINMPGGDVNSKLEVTGQDTPAVVVGGLDAEAAQVKAENGSATTVVVTMTVESKAENAATNSAEIKAAADGKTLEYLDIKVEKKLDDRDAELMATTTTAFDIVIPFDKSGKQNITVYRYHDGTAAALPSAANSDGEYFRVSETAITIYAKKFSTYAIGYTENSGQITSGPSGPNPVQPDTDTQKCPQDSTCPIHAFSDASETAWYHDGMHYCLEQELMIGTGNGQLGPDSGTTRAMLAVTLWKLQGSPVVDPELLYQDVSLDAWYSDAIRWATAEEIMQGYGNGSFGPEDILTREQMISTLYRFAEFRGQDVSSEKNILEKTAVDAERISTYALPAVEWAVSSELLYGMTEETTHLTLHPQGETTRAQMAALLWRFCTKLMK